MIRTIGQSTILIVAVVGWDSSYRYMRSTGPNFKYLLGHKNINSAPGVSFDKLPGIVRTLSLWRSKHSPTQYTLWASKETCQFHTFCENRSYWVSANMNYWFLMRIGALGITTPVEGGAKWHYEKNGPVYLTLLVVFD